MNGKEFGRYSLLKRLATGGMAEVYLARQAGLEGFEKLLVVKRILPHLADDQEFVEMFLNEARIAARFNHPNIVQIYDLGKAEDSYFIAMEFIHGEDLGRVARKAVQLAQPLPLAISLRIVAQVCDALYYAHHAKGDGGQPLQVIHRDISPQNVIVSFEGAVKLVDFGIARAANIASNTRAGAIKGKFVYMSPEQAAGKSLDARSDLFSLGLVLYELITGTRPLRRDSEILTLKAAMDCDIHPPSQVGQVDPELDALIMKALAKDPDERYQDARAFQLALEGFLTEKRWNASTVHVSEYMKQLFASRLSEEARLGVPVVHGADSSSAIPKHGGDWSLGSGSNEVTDKERAETIGATPRHKPGSGISLSAEQRAVGAEPEALGEEDFQSVSSGPKPAPEAPKPAVAETRIAAVKDESTRLAKLSKRGRRPTGEAPVAARGEEDLWGSDGPSVTAPRPKRGPAPPPEEPFEPPAPVDPGPRPEPHPDPTSVAPAPVHEVPERSESQPKKKRKRKERSEVSAGSNSADPYEGIYELQARRRSSGPILFLLLAAAAAVFAFVPAARHRAEAFVRELRTPDDLKGQALLSLDSNVEVEVFLGQERLGATPLRKQRVPIGTVALKLVAANLGLERQITFQAHEGEHVARWETFSRGKVRFHSKEPCEVFVRGRRIARVPGPVLDYYAGAYEMECRNEPLGLVGRARVTIPEDAKRTVEVSFDLSPM